MQYLHTMIRVSELQSTLDFFCNVLDFVEINRKEVVKGRFTLVFLAARDDVAAAEQNKAPMLELTYNWPSEDGEVETYSGGRNFGHLAYRVDNIYSTCQAVLDHGATVHRPPREGHMAFIKTPDGISIELLQSGDALEPAEPWMSMENTGTW